MEKREKIIEKLAKIKTLAERGTAGEKETAAQMYEALKAKYNISDKEVQQAAVEPPDISKVNLRRFGGLSFRLTIVIQNLAEEMCYCEMCEHKTGDDLCRNCGTYGNIKDLQEQYASIQDQIQKAAMEV